MKIDLSILNKKEVASPLYTQLKALLRGAIQAGVYAPGEKLDSERELIEAGKLSYPTVARALRELAQEGWVTRKIGSGTFVSESYLKHARRLRRVAVLYYNTETPYFKKTFAGIEQECARHHIEAIPFAGGMDETSPRKLMDELSARHIDGILGLPFGSLALANFFTRMIQKKFPIVITGSYFHLLPCDSVTLNNEKGAYEMTEYLLRLGHRRIAFLGNIPRYPFSMLNIEAGKGVNGAVQDSNVGATVDRVLFPTGLDEKSPEFSNRIKSLFANAASAPTAVICEGEGLARLVYCIAGMLGLSIPGDVSVAGFGNFTALPEMEPPLTCVDWPLGKAGEEAVKLMVSRAALPDQPPIRMVLETSLVIRKSTAAPRR